MKNRFLLASVLSAFALTGVANAQTGSGNLAVSAAVVGSINLTFVTDTSGLSVTGTGRVDPQETVTFDVPGASAAYCLDGSLADANADNGVVSLTGRQPRSLLASHQRRSSPKAQRVSQY